MTVQEAFDQLTKLLLPPYGAEEARSIARIALEDGFGWKQPYGSLKLDEKQIERLFAMATRLQAHEPVQYVVGKAFFYGYPFRVTPATLIPRPETEELVHWILEDRQESALRVLDVGTGTGCIPIVLQLKKPSWKVVAIDLSEAALEVAAENAAKLGAGVDFRQVDFLTEAEWGRLGRFDLLVSNPPYIPQKESAMMEANVLQYEPHLALFVSDDDPLLFYRKIRDFAQVQLESGGSIYLEVNEFNAKQVMGLFAGPRWKEAVLKRDIQGKDRMLKAICHHS